MQTQHTAATSAQTSEQKKLTIIGSTGSIGTQALEIVAAHPQRYRVVALCAGTRVDELASQARAFRPRLAVIADEALLPRLRQLLDGTGIETAAGSAAVAQAAALPETDMLVNATVGYSGLEPTIAAIKAGKEIALANKETLVVAGELIKSLLAQSASKLYPIDSEHSAIAQCLVGEKSSDINRLIITASGGPFRTWSRERLANATVADALNHPTGAWAPRLPSTRPRCSTKPSR